jgi:prepilin-type N-terminal cleavage/methylation domain-containing protein
MTLPSRRASRAFTLVELLVVIAIMAIMAAVAIPALKGLNAAGQFNKSLRQITATIDQARSYAVAQNTYVWVLFYKNPAATASTLDSVYVAAFASNDGTDTVGIGNSGTLTPPAAAGTPPPFSQIFRPQSFAALKCSLPSGVAGYPTAGTTTTLVADPATAPGATLSLGKTTTLSTTPVAVIEFLPSGGVQVNAKADTTSLIAATALVFEPLRGDNQVDPNHLNMATIWINGITGLTAVYRK